MNNNNAPTAEPAEQVDSMERFRTGYRELLLDGLRLIAGTNGAECSSPRAKAAELIELVSTQPHSPDAADSGRVDLLNGEMLQAGADALDRFVAWESSNDEERYACIEAVWRAMQERAPTAALAAQPQSAASPVGVPDGVAIIAAERKRQISVEGWTPRHDAQHDGGEMAVAAACYATPANYMLRDHTPPMSWPLDESWWKPGDRLRELAKAGALIAAEIDRLAAAPQPGE